MGLVPSNYLLELSQFLTQDVGSKNGSSEPPPPNGAPRPNTSNGWVVINWLEALLLTFSNIRNINTSGSVNEEVRGKPWYFGQISRSECDILMAEKGQDGDFLVRDSESTVSSFDLL